VPEDVLNAFCWIHSTYSIPSAFFKKVGVDVPFPGVDHTRNYLPEDRKFAKYYQWVGFTLFVQVNYDTYQQQAVAYCWHSPAWLFLV
jgi:hypothetical protein